MLGLGGLKSSGTGMHLFMALWKLSIHAFRFCSSLRESSHDSVTSIKVLRSGDFFCLVAISFQLGFLKSLVKKYRFLDHGGLFVRFSLK